MNIDSTTSVIDATLNPNYVDEVIALYGSCMLAGYNYISLPYTWTPGAVNIQPFINPNGLAIGSADSRQVSKVCIIAQYTKAS